MESTFHVTKCRNLKNSIIFLFFIYLCFKNKGMYIFLKKLEREQQVHNSGAFFEVQTLILVYSAIIILSVKNKGS